MKILLVYYHPVVFDLALTFRAMGHDVFVAINQNIKDNYGQGSQVLNNAKIVYKNQFEVLPLSLAVLQVKKFDLVGLDGVFDGDRLVIDACLKQNVPYFAISGYPHTTDEPSKNILSFSWFMPQIQYKQAYPSEAHIKEIDWKNIAEIGETQMKNMFVFYPICWEWKAKLKCFLAEDYRNGLLNKRKGFVSAIHRFKECNHWSYEIFKEIESIVNVSNLENKNKDEVFSSMVSSQGLLHLKHGDCPGMAVLEAMLVGCIPIVMKSFVLASFNQDVIIDRHSGLICSSQQELVENLLSFDRDDHLALRTTTIEHAQMLSSYDRQKFKLDQFLNKCINKG